MNEAKPNRREFHPAVSISSWLMFALSIELAVPSRLTWLAALAALGLSVCGAWKRFFRLAWRARWLWLALMVFYSWTMPGQFILPAEWSPSVEGLQAGLERLGRLLLLLAALAVLLSLYAPRELAAGLYLLSRPLKKLGLDRRAFAVRLVLTLEWLERSRKPSNWMEVLRNPPEMVVGPSQLQMHIPRTHPRDLAVLGVTTLILLLVLV